ncbi:hypothetical protein BH11PAT4_BH11PAT4_2030 [soil metagenome]
MRMKQQTTLTDSRIIGLALVAVLLCGAAIWRPWTTVSSKTIDVIGEGTVKALPDEYSFNPSYQESAEDVTKATEKVNEKGNAVVEKLKSLGVSNDDITTNVSAYQNYYAPGLATGPYLATFSLSATVPDQTLAEAVTSYIATTGAINTVTPQATFNSDTRAKLELEARQKAIDSAKVKAEQTVKAMGTRLGKVVKIADVNTSFPQPYPLYGTAVEDKSTEAAGSSTSGTRLQTGKQDITFTVTVTYRYY